MLSRIAKNLHISKQNVHIGPVQKGDDINVNDTEGIPEDNTDKPRIYVASCIVFVIGKGANVRVVQ